MFEIEIKARINNRVEIKAELEKRTTHIGSFIKKDIYYKNELEESSEKIFRLRCEETSWHNKPIYRVTLKEKQTKKECEINREIEFSVDNPSQFEEFTLALGYKEFIRKEKQGELYKKGTINYELNLLVGLRDYLELETLTPDTTHHDEIQNRLIAEIKNLGIPAEQIKPEYYINLLKRAKNQNNPTKPKIP